MKIEKEELAMAAILGAVFLEGIALIMGMDGTTLIAVVGILSGLGGVIVGAKTCETPLG